MTGAAAVWALSAATSPPAAAAEVPAAGPPPVASTVAPTPRFHRWGVQVGGTGFLQVAYRYGFTEWLHLEAGLLGGPHGVNASLGMVLTKPVEGAWQPYVGFGGGVAGAGGPTTAKGCDPAVADCTVNSSDGLRFAQARVGVGFRFGSEQRSMVALDVGGWYGRHDERTKDAAGTRRSSRAFLWPMAGFAYLYAF
jgi:hypothetical protein